MMIGVSGSPGGGGTLPSTPPVAAFEFSPSSPSAGSDVEFTDLSTNVPTSWSWTVDGVEFSIAQNPRFYFSFAGTYTVVLIATNFFGFSTVEHSVTVV